jgi:acetyl-CoA hydrolase
MKLLELRSLDFSTIVRPGDCVAWGQSGAEPLALTHALMAQRESIGTFGAFIGATLSGSVAPECADRVHFRSYCGAGENRRLALAGALDVLPCHYSELPALIRGGRLKIDVLLLQVAPADADGRYSLSIAHEYLIAALDVARTVVVEINDRAPWTYGERSISESDIDFAVATSRVPLALSSRAPSDTEIKVAQNVAGLIGDGATLQFGIGSLPEAVLTQLGDRRDLGIHTGALVDEAAALAAKGVINNARKSIDRGVTIAGVMMGGPRVYDYAHRNTDVQFRSVEYTHALSVIARIDSFVAINSAIEVDLTGQINSEVADGVYVGAVGGAVDFLRGAARSSGGLPIVAMTSVAGKSSRPVSKIVHALRGPVSTSRADAGIIVTEHGVADLRGLSLAQRRTRMLAIADPAFRESLAAGGD